MPARRMRGESRDIHGRDQRVSGVMKRPIEVEQAEPGGALSRCGHAAERSRAHRTASAESRLMPIPHATPAAKMVQSLPVTA